MRNEKPVKFSRLLSFSTDYSNHFQDGARCEQRDGLKLLVAAYNQLE